MSFSERLKVLRESLELNQTEIAELAGVSRINYNRYEAGKVVPTVPFLGALYRSTRVNLVWLLVGEGEMMGTGGLTGQEMEMLECWRVLPEGKRAAYFYRIKADALEAGMG